jgi:uncharacterized protein (DUF2336 family)
LFSADRFTPDEITVFDEAFLHLITTIEESARALLSLRLTPFSKARPKVLRALACDDAIDKASSILVKSEDLDESTLIECARTKSHEHLLRFRCVSSWPVRSRIFSSRAETGGLC